MIEIYNEVEAASVVSFSMKEGGFMAKGKYEEWLQPEGLLKIEGCQGWLD